MTIPKNPAAVALGRLGGKAGTGKAKARPSDQCRQNALKGWETRPRKNPCP